MGHHADILARAKRLVERLEMTEVCAPCIGERIDGPELEAVQIAVSEMAATREFERLGGACGLCGEHGPTIRKRR